MAYSDRLQIPNLIIDEIFPECDRSSLKSLAIRRSQKDVMALIKSHYFRIAPNRMLGIFFSFRKLLGRVFRIDKKSSAREMDFRIGGRVDFFTVTGMNEHEIVLHNETNIQESVFELAVFPENSEGCILYNKTKVRMLNAKGWFYWYLIAPFHHYIVRYYLDAFKTIAEDTRGV